MGDGLQTAADVPHAGHPEGLAPSLLSEGLNRLSGAALPVIALVGAVGLGCASLTVFGTGTRGIRHSLEITARWSYLWFWVAYAGGALCKAFGERFRFAAKHRREFGLAFATAHSIHLI